LFKIERFDCIQSLVDNDNNNNIKQALYYYAFLVEWLVFSIQLLMKIYPKASTNFSGKEQRLAINEKMQSTPKRLFLEK
jgi:hypothetical protein